MNPTFYNQKISADIALNSISDGVFCTDINGLIVYLNHSAENLTGWTRPQCYGLPCNKIFKLINATTRKPALNPVKQVLKTSKPSSLKADTILIKRDGSEFMIEDSASPIHDEFGVLNGVVVVFHDVSDAKSMSMKIAHLALHDFLTNLPNRALLNDRIAHSISISERNHSSIAILFIDIDNFKNINDSFGHSVGDRLLRSVSQCLTKCVRHADTVSRLGGDEFIILLTDLKDGNDSALTAEKILEELNQIDIKNKVNTKITASIGISTYPNDGDTPEQLIKNADTAMYYAKQSGRNNYQFYRPELDALTLERQLIETNLHIALEKNQFKLLYQPKFNLLTKKITGVEALIRWEHDDWGEMLPNSFISIAEDSGLIIPIGNWVMQQACIQAKQWVDSGLPSLTIAINISAQEFLQKNFVDNVKSTLLESNISPHCLELEITESVLMQEATLSTKILHELKQLGVKLAVDDFGTGYSSLSYLQQFPIDVLKIDQSFVQHISSEQDEGIIVSAIISMGNSLRLKVIAEGIENQLQLDFLLDKQCEEGQGYYFSKALSADNVVTLLSGREII